MQSQDFFAGRGRIFDALRAVTRALESAGIDYAILGGLALNAHGYARETVDVDVLISPGGLDRFKDRYEGRGFVPAHAGSRKRFRETATNVVIEFITQGEYPGDGRPKPVVYPDPQSIAVEIGGIRFIGLVPLIEFKLASGMTAPERLRDLADVQDLARVLKLDVRFAESLNPFVREKFIELIRPLAGGPAETTIA